ncbi:MAG: DNA methyltransferase [Pirellulaceae bacterium]
MATTTRLKPSKIDGELPIGHIRVGARSRKDLGDLDSLATNISEIGLLHAVVVSPDNRLIAGFRRLQACKKLGWKTVPVRVIDLDKIVEGEFAENVCRKDFALSEIAAIAKKLRPVVEARARQRQIGCLMQGNNGPDGTNLPNGENGKSRDIIARYVGVSGMTLEKVEAIVEAAEENPEKYGHLKERMDATGKVNKHWQQLRVAQLMGEKASRNGKATLKANTIMCGDCTEIMPQWPKNTFDAVIFDPPWGVNYEYDEGRERNNTPESYWNWLQPIYKETMRLLKPGGFWACWQSHNYFSYFWQWFGSDIQIFAACKDQVRLRQGRSYGWEPIILKWKSGRKVIYPYGRKKVLDFFVSDWKAHLQDKLAGQHPCPRPVDVLEALIDNYTTPGALILDPTCGSGSVCVAAARCKPARQYVGIEISQGYAALAEQRIKLAARGRSR